MNGASRILKGRIESKKSRVLRPAVTRWLKGFRQSEDQHSGETGSAGVVRLLPSVQPVVAQNGSETAGADAAERICELRQQSIAVDAACEEWTDRRESLERSLVRAQEKCDRACARVTLAAGLVTDAGTDGLSTLQASYRNFTLALETQEEKLAHAKRKLAGLQNRQTTLRAELLALSEDPGSDEQTFQRAA